MTGTHIIIGLFIVVLLYGIVAGDFFETWRNGATL